MKQSPHSETDYSEESSLGDVLYKYLRFWPLFLFLMVVGLSLAWLYMRYTPRVYQTKASILIKDAQNNSSNDVLDAFNMFSTKKTVENEVEILKSSALMKEVVTELGLYASVMTDGRIMSQSAYLNSPVMIIARNPESIKKATKINFTFNPIDQTIRSGKETWELNKFVQTDYGTIKFVPNSNYRPGRSTNGNHETEYYFSLNSVKNTANSLRNRLNVNASSKQSTVIEIAIRDEVPERGEDIIDNLMKLYNKAAIQDKNVLAANTLKFVDDRLKFVSSDLDSVEGSLQQFKSNNKITDISSQGQIFLQTVSVNDQKISDINMQLAVLDQVEAYVKSKGTTGGIVPATMGINDPILSNLLQKLTELELQYTQLKTLVPENNPQLISVVDGMEKLRPGIMENIQNQRRSMIAGREDLISTNERYTSMLRGIPRKEMELLGITRQQAIKSGIYTFLLQKREETMLSFASTVADSRIIDHAESSDIPVSPKKKIIFLGAILGSIILGVGMVYLKDLLTQSIQGKSELEKYTAIPVLGEIVYDRSKTPIVISEGKRSFVAEQFRHLRTSLSYLGIDENHKKVLITSSISGEGKSFVVTNMGITLSLMNKKVAVLEFDLRKPKLSEQFKLPRNTGITSFLIGKKQPEEIIFETSFSNLFFLPSGPIPPNPSELISNGRLNILLDYLQKNFDYILIDSAPVNPVTDSFILSKLSDVTLFIVRHDFTPKLMLQKLERLFRTDKLKNPAIIYNGVKGKGLVGNRYGYGYGYGYTEDLKPWWRKVLGK